MKKCTHCGKRKPTNMFYRNTRGHCIPACKKCNAIQSSQYYYAHKSQVLEKIRKYASDNKTQLRELRARRRKRNHDLVARAKSKPCVDCGQSFIPFVMDLDHVRGKKLFALSQHGIRPASAIKKEISKCDNVCANCHRIRTWTRWEKNHEKRRYRSVTNSG